MSLHKLARDLDRLNRLNNRLNMRGLTKEQRIQIMLENQERENKARNTSCMIVTVWFSAALILIIIAIIGLETKQDWLVIAAIFIALGVFFWGIVQIFKS